METVNENVMRKLAKIKALADNAGTEGEAMAAANMLNELLMKHKLGMSDIQWEEEVKTEPVERHPVGGGAKYANGKYTYADYPDVEIKSKRLKWSEDLARMISRAYGCSWLLTVGSSRITFVGRKSNVMIVEYMYITMYRVIEKLSWKEYKTARNKVKWEQIKHLPKSEQSSAYVDYRDLSGYRSAWVQGFVDRVRELLEDMRRNEEQAASSGTALMRINSDATEVAKFMQGMGKAVNSLRGNSAWNAAGREAGRAKASEVGLTATGMNKGAESKQLG